MEMIIISEERLKELLEEAIMKAVSGTTENKNDEVLNASQLSTMLGVSSTTLWRLEKRGAIRPKRLGRKKLYILSEVKNALKREGF